MSFRLATVCLLVLALALPWPALAHAMAGGDAGAKATTAQTTGSDDASVRTSHTDCHGKSNANADAVIAIADDALGTDTRIAGQTHDCCSGDCDCGCLTTASAIAVLDSSPDTAPAMTANPLAETTTPVARTRLLRPPIHG